MPAGVCGGGVGWVGAWAWSGVKGLEMGIEKIPGLVSAWSAWPPLASGEVR